LLLDLNGVILNQLTFIHRENKVKIDENLIREISLSVIGSYVRKYKSSYKEVVIACDNKKYWRKDYFPFYKATRRYDRLDAIDWGLVFDTITKLKIEFRDNLPYKVIDIDGAEADDIIAVLAQYQSEQGDKALIVSSDQDFMQLQKYPGVQQYSPYHKTFMVIDHPNRYLKEKILCGDRGDGIPNFLSGDDVFVTKTRQKPIMKKKLEEWVNQEPEDFCDRGMLRGYKRNQRLIDFDYIPTEIRNEILEQYTGSVPSPRAKLLDYFMNMDLKNMTQNLSDF
jgi:hypothetical protein